MIEKKTDPFTGEEKYEMNEDDVKEISLGVVLVSGVAGLAGAVVGYKFCKRVCQIKIGKALPEVINRAGELGANAAIDATYELGNHDVRRLIDHAGGEICGKACDKFYSKREVKEALKFYKKMTK